MRAIKSLNYQSPFSKKDLKVVMSHDSFYMTQVQMSKLFCCGVKDVYILLKTLFASGELEESFVNRSIEIENYEGRYVSGNFYNLDAIIAVGYRLNPKEATHFHIWSTQMLKIHLYETSATREYGIIESIRRKFSHMLAVA